jgi:hypothetical protein
MEFTGEFTELSLWLNGTSVLLRIQQPLSNNLVLGGADQISPMAVRLEPVVEMDLVQVRSWLFTVHTNVARLEIPARNPAALMAALGNSKRP